MIDDIEFPRTMFIEELGLRVVFSDIKDMTVVNIVDPKNKNEPLDSITVEYKGNTHELTTRGVYRGIFSFAEPIHGHKFSYVPDAQDGLIWDIERRLVGHQDGDKVIIVDSMKYRDSEIGKEISVEERNWVTMDEFAEAISVATLVLLDPIAHDEVVIFEDMEQLEDYLILTTGKIPRSEEELFKSPLFPDDMKMGFPMVQSKHYSFPLNNVESVIKKKESLSRAVSYEDWKKDKV